MLSYPMIVVAAPSGSGKSTLVHYLMDRFPCLTFSISATTRQLRTGEIDGSDYYFIGEKEFKNNIEKEDFLEWEMVYQGIYYGTLKTEIERILERKKIPILDIDVKGALSIKEKNSIACNIFIDVPSLDVLKTRLIARNTESIEKVNIRIEKATYERSFKNQFDFCVMNEHLPIACEELEQIVAKYLNSYVVG